MSTWDPVVVSARSSRAILGAVQHAAVRLGDPSAVEDAAALAREQTLFPRSTDWHPMSVGQGWAGLALSFGYLDRCFPRRGWDRVAHQYLQLTVAELPPVHQHSAGLFSGWSGLALVARYLSRRGRRYRSLLGALDAAVLEAATLMDDTMPERGGCPVQRFDLISGWAGIVAYLLQCQRVPQAARELRRLLSLMVTITGEDDGVPRWHTPGALIADPSMARNYSTGVLNCGLAHGIPGPIVALSMAWAAGVRLAGMPEAVRRSVDWLIRHSLQDEWGVNWPTVVPLDDGDRRLREVSRGAWCYGSPGVARALWCAGRAFGAPAWQALALDALRSLFRRPLAARDTNSTGFCHGLAGVLQLALRFYHSTRRSFLARGARALASAILERFDASSPLGFRCEDRPGLFVDRPWLLDGAAGTMITLLAAVTPVEPLWDRLVLLS